VADTTASNSNRKGNIMLVHTVFFWLKEDLAQSQVTEFQNGLESLKGIESAEAVYVGTPSDSVADRPVIDCSYNFNLTVIFKDVDAHNEYQVDPAHKTFLETFKPMFAKVQIYDAD